MRKPKISIIIPIYNAEKYLERCLKSIISQSFSDIDIICVNDSSTDNSKKIIDKYADNDKRMRVLSHNINKGAQAARNLGLDNAIGEYVSFVDADDVLLPGAYEKMYSVACQNNSDAVKGNMLEKFKFKPLRKHRFYHSIEIQETKIQSCEEIQHLTNYQTYIFRLDLIKKNDITFDENLAFYQDNVFLAHLLSLCGKISLIKDPVYVHYINKGSVHLSQWNFDYYRSLISFARTAYHLLNDAGCHSAAAKIASIPCNYWTKIEKMPVFLTEKECFKVFSLLRELYDEVNIPLWNNKSSYKSKLIISLIYMGYNKEALDLLKKNNRFLYFKRYKKYFK